MTQCNICNNKNLTVSLDLGPRPVCHHFIKEDDANDLYPLRLGQCEQCATVQIVGPLPTEALVPKYPWITCTEPEEHLDELVDKLAQLPGIDKSSPIFGISFKEDTTLRRFQERDFDNTWRIPNTMLDIKDDRQSVETVQQRLTEQIAEQVVANQGRADIVIARHIIEHAYDLKTFIQTCKSMLNPEGYLVFEIPDCQYALSHFDYTTIWEEHTIYFTPATFKQMFALQGLELIEFETIPYLQEQSHIGIAKLSTQDALPTLSQEELENEKKQATQFFQSYTDNKQSLNEHLSSLQNKYGELAMLGAGHMGCMFLNLMEIKDKIKFVVDDNPNMTDLYMPGTKLKIVSSQELLSQDIKMCLLSVSETSLDKVLKRCSDYLDKGGKFVSIFPGSSLALAY